MNGNEYRVQALRCPVIQPKDAMTDDPHDTTTMERCNAAVWVVLWVGPESGRGYGWTECNRGHTMDEMARDVALDLDGVPVMA